jgi:hypothetical protein
MNKAQIKRLVCAEASVWVATLVDGAERPEQIVTEADESRWIEACNDLSDELAKRGRSHV